MKNQNSVEISMIHCQDVLLFHEDSFRHPFQTIFCFYQTDSVLIVTTKDNVCISKEKWHFHLKINLISRSILSLLTVSTISKILFNLKFQWTFWISLVIKRKFQLLIKYFTLSKIVKLCLIPLFYSDPKI